MKDGRGRKEGREGKKEEEREETQEGGIRYKRRDKGRRARRNKRLGDKEKSGKGREERSR